MGAKGIRLLLSLTCLLAGYSTANPAAGEAHAVTGTVVTMRSDNKSPVQNVLVTACNKYGDSVTSVRSDANGKYLLTVPDPPEQYMLHYRHDDYLEDIKGFIANNDNHIMEDVALIPATVSNNVSAEWLEQYVNALAALNKMGAERGVALYKDVAQRNLLLLRNAFSPKTEAGARIRARMDAELKRMLEPPGNSPQEELLRREQPTRDSLTRAPSMIESKGLPPRR